MFCPSCGTESLPDQHFCKSCGASLHPAGDAQSVPAAAAAPVPPAVPPAAQAPVQYAPPQMPAGYPPAAAPVQYPPPQMPAGYPQVPPGYAPYPQMAPPAPKSSALRNIVILLVVAAAGYGGYRYYQNGKTVTIGTKDQVQYSGSATKEQALALGDALKTIGYFQDRGAKVLLKMGAGGTIISYVVEDGAWNDPKTVGDLETTTQGVASTIGGSPIDMRLVNSMEVVEKAEMINTQGGAATMGTKDQVQYSGTATIEQAMALGNRLKADNYFQDRGVTVLLNMGKSGTIISYVVQDGVWNKPDMVNDFEIITRDVASTVGGLPVDMRLVNDTETVEKDEMVTAQADTNATPANTNPAPANTNPAPADTTSTVTIGTKDQVIYSGQATQDQATALGNALRQAGYFQDRGVTVLLSKGGNGTVIAYVVQDGVWNNPAMVSDFETITRGIASTVGGLPIDMRLVNATEVVEKDEVVQ